MFSFKALRGFGFSFSIIFALSSCQQGLSQRIEDVLNPNNQSEDEEQAGIVAMTLKATPIKPAQRGWHKSIRGFSEITAEKITAWEVESPEDVGADSPSYGNEIVLDRKRSSASSRTILEGSWISSLILNEAKSPVAVGFTPRVVENGRITIESNWLVNGKVEKSWGLSKLGFEHDRLSAREAYERDFLVPTVVNFPRLYFNNGPRLAVDFRVESFEMNPNILELSAISDHGDGMRGNYVLPCVNEANKNTAWLHYGKSIGDVPIAYLTDSVRDGKKTNLRDMNRTQTSDNFTNFSASYCFVTDKYKVVVGSRKTNDYGGVNRKLVVMWFGEKPIEDSLSFGSNTVATAAAFDPRDGSLWIGGETNFTQLKSGSRTHGVAFVARFQEKEKRSNLSIIEGKRGTRVTAIGFGNNEVWVGGSTDLPSTHERDYRAASFLLKVQ